MVLDFIEEGGTWSLIVLGMSLSEFLPSSKKTKQKQKAMHQESRLILDDQPLLSTASINVKTNGVGRGGGIFMHFWEDKKDATLSLILKYNVTANQKPLDYSSLNNSMKVI